MEKQPLFTVERASAILGIHYQTIRNYVWVYKFIKPVASRPCRFDFDQLVALRRIRDMLRCGIPSANISDYLMLPQVSVEVGSSHVVNTIKFAEEQVEKGLKRYRRMMA